MKKLFVMLPLACSFSLLAGCETLIQDAKNLAMRIEPAFRINNSDMTTDALYRSGMQLQSSNQLDQAADTYRKVLAKEPGHVDARNALATVYARQNKFDDAIAELNTVLQQNPRLARIHSNLGYVHYLKKDYPAALSSLQIAITLDPSHARAFGNLALVYEQLGETEKARAASLHAAELNSTPVTPSAASVSTRVAS